ncbi:MAG: ribosome small subunit-dependent GTPase A [Spirochaetota bacterium]
MSVYTGVVAFGANNIFTVKVAGQAYQCRIKGKILRQDEKAYNPLAPGDVVDFEPDAHTSDEGLIIRRKVRENSLVRWNRKRRALQTVAANLDLLVVVASVKNPPFRPRFIDRVLIAAEEIPSVIVLNKMDLGCDAGVGERILDFRRMGYEVIETSVTTGQGIDVLSEKVTGRLTAFFGQSGVGKSSLLNRLFPGVNLQVGEISQKYDRGRHTTKNARLYEYADNYFIDTPGIRQIELGIDSPDILDGYFRDFLPHIGKCEFQPCSHLHEPGCAVRAAVESHAIHPDRYESYARIYYELEERTEYG